MDPALGGAELERLLAVLLRMLTPAAATQRASPSRGSDGVGRPAPDGPAAAPAPDGAASRSAAPGGTTAGGFPSVTASEARALTELLAAHGIAQGQLAALLGLEKSTVSRLAAGLGRKGGVRRGRGGANHPHPPPLP